MTSKESMQATVEKIPIREAFDKLDTEEHTAKKKKKNQTTD